MFLPGQGSDLLVPSAAPGETTLKRRAQLAAEPEFQVQPAEVVAFQPLSDQFW
jgi:hypothetical protein